MRLALAPKVAGMAEDTVMAEEDKVVAEEIKAVAEVGKVVAEEDTVVTEVDKVVAEEDTVVTEADEGVADEDHREAVASSHRHSTNITMIAKISPNEPPKTEHLQAASLLNY